MRIAIAAPVAAGSTKGNGTTARRWHVLLTELGHEVDCYGPDEVVAAGADILIALHARKSAAAVRAFRQAFPRRPVVVALTGTDLNLDLPDDPDARASVAAADRLVVLYVGAEALLEPEFREKAVPILQSATATSGVAKAAPFQVCVLAHLREVKDPLCVARAAARLPAGSPIRVVLAGSAYDDQHRDAARAAAAATPGFEWREECSTADAARLLAESHVMVISSRAEGGANVVSEAIAQGVPILASAIPGNIGLLGPDYPGYFPVGDDAALAELLVRTAGDAEFLASLERAVVALQPQVAPERERAAWAALLADLA